MPSRRGRKYRRRQRQQRTNVAKLSEDLTCHILRFLTAECLMYVRTVCRDWNTASRKPRVWKELYHRVSRSFDWEGKTVSTCLPFLSAGSRPNLVDRASYMSGYTLINADMRAILVDWLLGVNRHLQLREHVLYVAIDLLDRVLTRVECHRTKLQLVGICCLYLAAANASESVVTAALMSHLCANCYTEEQVEEMCACISSICENLSSPRRTLEQRLQGWLAWASSLRSTATGRANLSERTHFLLDVLLLDTQLTRRKNQRLCFGALVLFADCLAPDDTAPSSLLSALSSDKGLASPDLREELRFVLLRLARIVNKIGPAKFKDLFKKHGRAIEVAKSVLRFNVLQSLT